MNKINAAFLKSLINSEFLILSSSCKQNNRKLEHKVLSNTKNRVESSLNLFELVKALKQFIRVLQFLKNSKEKEFVICSSNTHISSFLHLYKKELSLPEFLKFEQDYRKVKSLAILRSLLLLEDLPTGNESFLGNFFEKNILIVLKVNAAFERDSYGTYKIYNEMSDYKKLIFLMLIIKKTFE